MSTSTSSYASTPHSFTSHSPTSHSSNSSFSSFSDASFPYSWMAEHLLMHPLEHELPLDTLFQYNASCLRPLIPPPPSPKPSDGQASGAQTRTARTPFEAAMIALLQSPTRPSSISPGFLFPTIRWVFAHEDVNDVEFGFALKALDYLRGLETKRRQEFAFKLKRMGFDGKTSSAIKDPEETSDVVSENVTWKKDMEEKSKHIERLYTQVYIGLRRWTCVNQMTFEPFDKCNCLAMLNTLFPPAHAYQPTRYLTPAVLHEQRHALSRYLFAVEQNGTRILDGVKEYGRKEERGDENGWPSVHEVLELYLKETQIFMNDCGALIGNMFIESWLGQDAALRGSIPDSRVSGSTVSLSNRPSTANKDKPLPAWPGQEATSTETTQTTPTTKGGSIFDKLARFFGHRKKEDGEKKEAESKTAKSLRKMKSTGTLRNLKERNQSSAGVGSMRGHPGEIVVDEELRKRTLERARSRAALAQAAAAQEAKPPSRPLVTFDV